MKTGEKIRNRRIELKMTMEDLGNAIGVQRSAINKYEKGLIDIKSSTLQAIANALNISPVLLLDDVEGEDVEQYVTEVPKNEKIRFLTHGFSKMPMEDLDKVTQMMQIMYAKYFDEKEKSDET